MEIKTILICLFTINLFMGLVLIAVKKTQKLFPGINHWIISNFTVALAYYLIFLKFQVPDFLAVLTANILLVSAGIIRFHGLYRFFYNSVNKKISMFFGILFLIIIFIMIIFTFIYDNVNIEVIVNSFFVSFLSILTGYLIFKNRPENENSSYMIISGLFFISSFITLIRIIFWILTPEIRDFFDSSNINILFYLSTVIIEILWTIMYLVINNQRLINDIKNNEQKYKSLIETTNTGFLILDKNGFVLDCNEEYVHLTGNNNISDILGRNITEWTDIKEIEKNKLAVRQCLQNGNIRNFEVTYVDKENNRKTIEINATIEKHGDNIRIISLCRDVTYKAKIEYEQHVKEWAIQSSLNAILITDLNGVITYVNSSFLKFWEIKDTYEVLGKNITEFWLNPDEAHEIIIRIKKNSSAADELIAKRKNQSSFTAYLSASLVYDFSGSPTAIFASFIDISEQKQLEIELMGAKIIADSTSRAKSLFLANMSHEIRTPLNSILGFTEILLMDDINETQRDYLETIKTSGESLLMIISDILDLSKIESGNAHLTKEVININKLISKIIENLSILAEKKDLSLNYELLKNDLFIYGDPYKLEQILVNVLGNAIKYTEKGHVKINIFEHERNDKKISLKFIIADTGIGIPKDKINIIFDTFQQVDSSLTRKFGGTGLGLSICKHLTDMMNGEIRVESQPGLGSTFIIIIPFEPADDDNKEINYNNNTIIDINKKEDIKILLVEDNLINQKYAKTIINKLGYNCDIASSGRKALEMLNEKNYNLIMMDLQMDEMNGIDATIAIRINEKGTGKHIPIIAMTAHVLKEFIDEAIDAGMDDYILKPLNLNDFSGIIKKYI